jgi:hypothetical protein
MKKNIIRIFLLFTCLLLIVVGSSIKLSSNDESVVREIGVEYKTHEEQLSLILDSFDSYNSDFSNNHLTFNSEKFVSVEENDYFEYLSNKELDKLTQKISTDYDLEKNVFTMTLSYYDGDTLVETSIEEIVPIYDEEKDDAYVVVGNNKYYFADTFDADEFEQCIAIVDDVAVASAVVIVGAVALTICAVDATVNYDVSTQIVREVETSFETVASKIRLFFSWFTRWIKKAVTRVVEKVVTVVTKVKTPAISVNNERIETTEISIADIKKKERNDYYLVFADTTNKKIYISKNIKKEIAIAILSFPIVVNCIGDSNVQMMASTFTIMKDDAYDITCEAGLNPRTPYEMPEFEYGFYHYHSIATSLVKAKSGTFENRSPHSFFYL